MSDFPSLADLVKKDDVAPASKTDAPIKKEEPKEAIRTIKDKFQKRMGDIKKLEFEKQAMRQAVSLGFPHINLDKFPISHEALRQISKEKAKEMGIVCFFATQDEVRLGALDPSKPEAKQLLVKLEEKNTAKGGLYLISQNSFEKVIKYYDTLPQIKVITKDIEIKKEDLEAVQADVNDFKSFQDLLKKKSTTDTVVIILGASLELGASDVHIEAEENGIMIRFRLDGILHEAGVLPKESFKRLISRLKLVSSLKINITDKPQDGRFTIKIPEGDVDVRVSTMPTVYGESVVMRLLRQNEEGLDLAGLGIIGSAFERLKNEIKRPNGMIITTGPTGSGKTTTLYSVLKSLNKPGVKIITLEDPVEYKLEGVNQSQIDKSKDYTFAKGLKSILRQDPDIVMVGEIRDLETADIAIQAALTGHLMLSTLHTNSAAAAIPRFLSMGVKPFLLGPSLNCVIGQRLVRKLCPHCKKEVPLEQMTDERIKTQIKELLEKLPEEEKAKIAGKDLIFYEAGECKKCNNLGYKGRIGIYEVFTINKEIEEAMSAGQISEYQIEELALKNGMVTMVQDGIIKALEGITSLQEVFRVIE